MFDKKFVLCLIFLNFIGVIASFIVYLSTFAEFLDKFYLIPFIPISFILYSSMFLFWVFVYKKKNIPEFLLIFTFFVNFVYGLGSFIFYPLLMIFILGFSYYHFWNVFAHGFLGLQSFLVLKFIKKVKFKNYIFLGLIIFTKDFLDFFYDTFTYFTNYEFGLFKYFLIVLILILQFLGIYLLVKGSNETIRNFYKLSQLVNTICKKH